MISRRKFLAASAAFPFVLRAAEKPALHLGLVADPQYADADPIATRFYRQSVGKLTEAVEHFNGQELDFCVNVGDTIDHKWQSFDEMLRIFGKSKCKFYHLLGNHDFEVAPDEKAKAPGRLGLEKKYYSVTQNGFCFVMLDTNDVSVYAYPVNSREFIQAFEMLKAYAATGLIQAQTWNGAVGAEQVKWFEEACKKAAAANQKVIAFAHHPIFPFPHNRRDTNSFATAQIFSDRMVIAGKGREPSRELKFRAA
jgi:manganese-dependent ADP-ribose/CDP-alcohol diphosphatase